MYRRSFDGVPGRIPVPAPPGFIARIYPPGSLAEEGDAGTDRNADIRTNRAALD
jgi:hypothetical protein